jgi:hypothetical protein
MPPKIIGLRADDALDDRKGAAQQAVAAVGRAREDPLPERLTAGLVVVESEPSRRLTSLEATRAQNCEMNFQVSAGTHCFDPPGLYVWSPTKMQPRVGWPAEQPG